VAVIYESERLTYGQLNNRANQLAPLSEGAGELAPTFWLLCAWNDRFELVIALLAILRLAGRTSPWTLNTQRKGLENDACATQTRPSC